MTADFNGDGDPDLATSNRGSNDVTVLLGGAGGSFGAATSFAIAGTGPQDLAVGDFNDDGDPDLVVAELDSESLSVLLGDAGGTFGAPTKFAFGSAPRSAAVADFNGDGRHDIATPGWWLSPRHGRVLLNTTPNLTRLRGWRSGRSQRTRCRRLRR